MHRWTESERKFIRDNWNRLSAGQIAAKLDLTKVQVDGQIHSVMKLKRTKT